MFSAADRSPSENRLPARTTSGGSCFRMRELLGGHRRTLLVPRHAIQAFEHGPTGHQRRVEVHGSRESIDRARRIPQGHVAITALLVEETEPRMLLLESLQGFQRLGYAVQASLVGGDQVKDVAVLEALQWPALRPRRALPSSARILLSSRMRPTSSSIGDGDGVGMVQRIIVAPHPESDNTRLKNLNKRKSSPDIAGARSVHSLIEIYAGNSLFSPICITAFICMG